MWNSFRGLTCLITLEYKRCQPSVFFRDISDFKPFPIRVCAMSVVSHSLGLCSFPTSLSKKRFSVWDYCFVGCLSNALQFLLKWVPLACPAGLAGVVSVVSDTAGNPLAVALLARLCNTLTPGLAPPHSG